MHEYVRGGSLQYLAALSVRRRRVIGRCEERTGLVPFGRLVTQVMPQEPYHSARRLQRKVLTPNDVSSLDEIRTRIQKLEDLFSRLATPFDWRYTRLDLANLMQQPERPAPLAA